MAKSKKRGSPETRAYMRLTRHERNDIEHMLDQEKSCRAIAQELGRSPSTIKREVDRHRFITSPRALHGQPAPEDDLGRACPRLGAWPYCCNGCKKRRGYGCNRRPRVYYSARLAQQASDALLSSSRAGIDETEESARAKLEAIRDGLERGLSPEQIAHMHPELALSASTIYRWCDAGYERLSNMDLRRKVGYRPRKKRARAASTRHGPERSHQAFLAQGEDACAGAWEMDTVLGAHLDTACPLTLLHRPTRFQLVLRIAEKTSRCVEERLQSMRLVLGEDGCGRLFRSVLTDNGSEFADEDGIAHALGGAPIGDAPLLLRSQKVRSKGGLRAEPRRDQEDASQKTRHPVRQAARGGLRPRHVPHQLGAQGMPRVAAAHRCVSRGLSRRSPSPPRCLRHRGGTRRQARPHALLYRAGKGGKG